jgi:MFS family permease
VTLTPGCARRTGSPSLLLPLIVACALFIENMDATVLATALPMIARDLAVEPVALKLAPTSHLITLAVFIAIGGWVADRVGAYALQASSWVRGGGSVLQVPDFRIAFAVVGVIAMSSTLYFRRLVARRRRRAGRPGPERVNARAR